MQMHCSKTYRVFMLGFLPGFAYMGTVAGDLVMPRRETPRIKIAAGSVGIAGRQTGIYPFESPGGWNIIGRTPLKMFDVNRADAALLKPGDRVQFYPISQTEFEVISATQ
jgi:inhibitor of KinA